MTKLKRFTSLAYPFAMKVHIYPDYNDINTIKLNSDKLRWYYNHDLALHKWIVAIKLHYYPQYKINPILQNWIQQLYKEHLVSNCKKQYPWLRNKLIDSLVPTHAYQNYKLSCKNYKNQYHSQNKSKKHNYQHKHQRFHCLKDHPYTQTYQTSCIHYKLKSGYKFTVAIIDRYHLKISKLGKYTYNYPHVKVIRCSKIPSRVWRVHKLGHLRIGTVTITDDNCNVCTASFQLASDIPFIKLHKKQGKLAMLGYDLNVSNFMMDTNNIEITNPHFYGKMEDKLDWIRHTLSRKSNHKTGKSLYKRSNYQRNRLKLACYSKKVYNRRHSFLEPLSTRIVETQDLIVGESLESHNMMRNHYLAKSIQSVGWHDFIMQVAYKTDLQHKIYVLVNPAYTTQRCSNCGYVCNYKDSTHLTLKDRYWTCPRCGAKHVRDINAAWNILLTAIAGIQKYLPKKMRISFSKAHNKDNQVYTKLDMIKLRKSTSAKQTWLNYLVTHYYGVLDLAKPSVATLNTFHRIH